MHSSEQVQNYTVGEDGVIEVSALDSSEIKDREECSNIHKSCGCQDCSSSIKRYTVLGKFDVTGDLKEADFWNLRGNDAPVEAFVCDAGVIIIKFKKDNVLCITTDQCVRLLSSNSSTILALNPGEELATMIHSTATAVVSPGKVNGFVEASVDSLPSKLFLIEKGIIFFTQTGSNETFVFDEAGVRKAIKRRKLDFSTDLGGQVFLAGGSDITREERVEKARSTIAPKNVQNWMDSKKNQHYILSTLGFHIIQTRAGALTVMFGGQKKYRLKISPCGDIAEIDTPFVRVTASGERCRRNRKPQSGIASVGPHFFFRRGQQRIHYGNDALSLRDGKVTALIDSFGNATLDFWR